ncbi:phosphatase PAP2 family protein [Micromonospora sp. NPDC047707]|uniref:phosphatase PAP2 family protein n=1 Tax=Micromonospora sp. NPDC047707 TaxID=3154498 RepID=UPI003453E817
MRPEPAGRPPTGRLLRATLGYLLAFALTGVAFVWTAPGQRLDGGLLPRAERGGGYEQPTDLVEPAKAVLAWFGDPLVLGLGLGTVLLLAVLSGRVRAGLAGVALVGVTVLGAGLAKQVIIRPDLGVVTSTTHNSFPSGHVAAAMALLLALLLVLPARARWWFALPGAAGVSTVAAATMIAGWHRFSDVVGAVLLAAALFCLAAVTSARPGTGAAARPGTGAAAPLAQPGKDAAAAAARPGTRAATGTAGPAGAALGLLGLLGGLPHLAPAVPGGLFIAITAAGGLVVLVVAAVLVLVVPVDFGPGCGRPGSAAPEPDARAGGRRPAPPNMIDKATSAGMP